MIKIILKIYYRFVQWRWYLIIIIILLKIQNPKNLFNYTRKYIQASKNYVPIWQATRII